jgi:Transposase DDE domain group 1
MYEFFEAENIDYAIRLPANLADEIGYLLKPRVGRPPHDLRRYYASFTYRAQSWNTPRRVVAKVEWQPGELYPRVGLIVTNLARPAKRRRLLQPTRHPCGKGDQNGRSCHAALSTPMPLAASSSCWFAPSATLCGRRRCLKRRNHVANQASREVDQEQCEGREPSPLR